MDKAKLIELLNVWGETFRSALDKAPASAELREPCAAVAPAERESLGMYDEFPPKTLPRDVPVVFESSCAASPDRHLPAFKAYDGGGS